MTTPDGNLTITYKSTTESPITAGDNLEIPFDFRKSSQIKIKYKDSLLVEGRDYTVTIGLETTDTTNEYDYKNAYGIVTLNMDISVGESIEVYRSTERTQESSLKDKHTVNLNEIEESLDKLTMIAQEQESNIVSNVDEIRSIATEAKDIAVSAEEKITAAEEHIQSLSDELKSEVQANTESINTALNTIEDFKTNTNQDISEFKTSTNQDISEFKTSTNQNIEDFKTSTNQDIEDFKTSTNQDIEELSAKTAQEIININQNVEDFKTSTNRDISEFKTSTNQNIEDFKTSTNQDIEDFKTSTNQDISEFKMSTNQNIEDLEKSLGDKARFFLARESNTSYDEVLEAYRQGRTIYAYTYASEGGIELYTLIAYSKINDHLTFAFHRTQDKISPLGIIEDLYHYYLHLSDENIWSSRKERLQLNLKQDVIKDLDTIRANAKLGATALQEETDPIYSADKPNIALKSEIPDISNLATKEEVSAIASSSLKREIVNNLPPVSSAVENVIYLVPSEKQEDKNVRDEYLFVNGAFELIGTTKVDLSNYYNKDEVNTKLDTKQDTITDLDTIRAGAGLGATALQEETDPVYTADKPSLALKSEIPDISGKADKSEIPVVNNPTINVTRNDIEVGSFSLNQTDNKSINIDVPETAEDVGALPDSTKYGSDVDLSIDRETNQISVTLKDQSGNPLSETKTITYPLAPTIVSGHLDSETNDLVLVLDGGEEIRVPIADLLNGLQLEITEYNKLSADLLVEGETNKLVTQLDIDSWNNKITLEEVPKEIFIATDKSTNVEIYQAYQEGKTCFLLYANRYYSLSGTPTSTTAYFTSCWTTAGHDSSIYMIYMSTSSSGKTTITRTTTDVANADLSNLSTQGSHRFALKQDVIEDLDTIRRGAELGSTALQSYTETDPVYLADKPNIALKSEIKTKTSELTNDSDFITSAYHDDTKQDVIDDLYIIRSGAQAGSTALQEETDPIYTADKPNIALKSEIPDTSNLALKSEIPDGVFIATKETTFEELKSEYDKGKMCFFDDGNNNTYTLYKKDDTNFYFFRGDSTHNYIWYYDCYLYDGQTLWIESHRTYCDTRLSNLDTQGQAIIDGKQDVLMAGDNITIENNTISAKSGGLPIGSEIMVPATSNYVPEGCLLKDGSEYTKEQFPDLWENYLNKNRLNTTTYTDYAIQVSNFDVCESFAIDTANGKFKVPYKVSPKRFLVKSYKSGSNWYNLYSDGWCEQGGHVGTSSATSYTINFHVPYKDTNISVLCTDGKGTTKDADTEGVKYAVFISNLTTSGFKVSIQTTRQDSSWEARGYTSTVYSPVEKYYVAVANAQVNQSQMDWSAWASSLNGKANIDGSNWNTSVKNVDGQWVSKTQVLSHADTAGVISMDVSSYLPNDGYNYEVLLLFVLAKSGTAYARIYSDIMPQSSEVGLTVSGNGYFNGSYINVPVGSGRVIYRWTSTTISAAGYYGIEALGYRRIGTNS